MKILKLILILTTIFCSNTPNIIFAETLKDTSEKTNIDACVDIGNKNVLISGWFLWEPYQFERMARGGYELTGMDIELGRAIAKRVGVELDYTPVPWGQHQADLKSGRRDIATVGATYSDARAEYVYFSTPYRFEENSLFALKNSEFHFDFGNIEEYLAQIRLQNFRLGHIPGFVYAHPKINEFMNDKANQDIIFSYDNDVESLRALIRGEVDGFMADTLVGAAVIVNGSVGDAVKEVKLNIKTPLHFLFSKKTMSLKLVDRFNQEIEKFTKTSEYKQIIKSYLYPVLLLQTIESQWFYIIGVIGTIAFAISGIAIAAKENSTLFGTFLFAMLPSVAGGIMRDIIVQRDTVGIFLTPSYIYYIIIIVLIGFATIRLLGVYNKRAHEDTLLQKFWENILVVCDALGQAAFIVIGVSIVIMVRIEPIALWGTFFAFLTSNGGRILRDLMRSDKIVSCVSGPLYAEVSVFWGLIFSLFLDYIAADPKPDTIVYAVIITAGGAFMTRLGIYYFKVPNLKFRNSSSDTAIF